MLTAYATGVIALLAVMVAWVAVQLAWRKAFPGACSDPDVLAERTDCCGARCAAECTRRPSSRAVSNQEEIA
jgi:hypothetical protein